MKPIIENTIKNIKLHLKYGNYKYKVYQASTQHKSQMYYNFWGDRQKLIIFKRF